MKQKLKILQINALGATLSTGRTTRELHNYLVDKGYQSIIACPRDIDCKDVFTYSSRIQVHLDVNFSQLTGYEATFSVLPTLKLLHFIEREKPNIVHLRNLHTYSLNIKMLLKFLGKNNIPTVITLHDCWFMTGLCTYYTVQNCYKWQSGCHDCGNLYMSKYKLLFDRTKAMWKNKKEGIESIHRLAIIGVSDWITNEAKKSYLRSAKIINRIYNWIDLRTFYPKDITQFKEQLGLKKKKIVLGVAASWMLHSRKGLDTFIELASKLPNDYHVLLVGDMNYNGVLPVNILAVGRACNTSDLACYYSLADVFLNLSLEETFGKVTAEALACGTPVIAIDSTANKELVPPGGGIILDTNDVENIKKAVIEVVSHPKDTYTRICRSFAEENFNKYKNMEEYIDIYNSLCKS